MKRFFTFLMAMLALLSISQAVKADDVTVYFQSPDGWSTPVYAYVYDDASTPNHYKAWEEADECTPYNTSTGIKLWKYTFPDQFTNVIFKDGTHQHPGNDGSKMKVVNNYVYTINSTTGTSLSEFDKVTKVIKLLNGSSELTGSNGKYTLDLSSATDDATIKLTIDGATYGLAAAKTIAAAGTTSGIAFTTEGTAALTLKAGLIYTLTVTEDGKMTVVAEEKVVPYSVAGAGFYLVGDFMSQYNDKNVNPGGDTPSQINYERLYFKFEEQKDGSYQIVIPACLTARMQILGVSVDGVPKVYGPKGIEKLHGAKEYGKANPATDGSVGGDSETNNLVAVEGFNYNVN